MTNLTSVTYQIKPDSFKLYESLHERQHDYANPSDVPDTHVQQQTIVPSSSSSYGSYNTDIYSTSVVLSTDTSAPPIVPIQAHPKSEQAQFTTSSASQSSSVRSWATTWTSARTTHRSDSRDTQKSGDRAYFEESNYGATAGTSTGSAAHGISSDFYDVFPFLAGLSEAELQNDQSSAYYRNAAEIRVLDVSRLDSSRFTERQTYYLQYFIQEVNLNFTTLDESFHPANGKLLISGSNFWSFVVPNMATTSAPLLHAVLAIAALHESNIDGSSEHAALLDYHQSIRELAVALQRPAGLHQEDLLATCLILAYFETMSGETAKWGRHLLGAGSLVKAHISAIYLGEDNERSEYFERPAVIDHLIWFYIHQDTIQCILSGNGLFLTPDYIEACPLRGAPGTVTHASDQLRVLLARVGHFVSEDKIRKKHELADPASLERALMRWEILLQTLLGWREQLPKVFIPYTKPESATPCGPALFYQHPAIASIHMMSLTALLCLHRAHPHLSSIPAEAIRSSIATTYSIGQDIIRMLGGVMEDGLIAREAQDGAHLKAMINAVLPSFLAGIAIREPSQRQYLESMLHEIFRTTGWRSAVRVLQGLDVAWKRKPKEYIRTPSVDHGTNIQREGAGLEESSESYVAMDKPEMLGSVAGVLGRLAIVQPQTYVEPLPAYLPDGSHSSTLPANYTTNK